MQASNSRARSARPVARSSSDKSKASSVKAPAKDRMPASNGEVEAPPRSAESSATTPCSRSPATIVRGRSKPAYCARTATLTQSVPRDLTKSWRQPQPQRRQVQPPKGADRTWQSARAHSSNLKRRVFALALNVSGFSSIDDSWLGTLTVKLRGRPETPDKRCGRTLSSSACGA